MGLAHSRRLAEDDRSAIAAFFDPDQSAAEQLRDSFAANAVVHTSMDNLLSDTAADAAIIATPTSSHFDQIRAAADRGWHVLSEKPLADSRERTLELIRLAADHGTRFVLGYQRRFWTLYRRVREEIQSGRHGRILSVHSVATERWQQTIAGTWRDDPHINPAGFLGDAGSHTIDILFFTTGLTPVDVFAISDRCGSRVDIVSSITGRLEGDVPLTMTHVGNAKSFHRELFIHCEHSDLIVREFDLWIARNNQLEPVVLPATESGPESTRNPVSGFLDLLTEEGINPAPFECALPVFDFTSAVIESARVDAPVAVNVAISS